jgi:spermidine synthase
LPKLFEELAYRETAIGLLSLRRRRQLQLDIDVLEITLGDEHLMSDLFTESEIALARLGLDAMAGKSGDIVVGGLGLGYTAQAVLAHDGVRSLCVIEALDAVIDWHEAGLIPLGRQLSEDTRCRFVHGDFFAMSRSTAGFDPLTHARKFDAILVDIDHAPDRFLHPSNAEFYAPEGLGQLQTHLKPGGVFGLWSDDRPDNDFTERLGGVFASAWSVPVTFRNPLQDRSFTQTIYLARKADTVPSA